MENQTFTPRGLTQNWNFIEENSRAKKGRKGGPFVSRSEQLRDATIRRTIRETPQERVERDEDPEFKVKIDSEGNRFWQPRKNGKFQKRLKISASLAVKLGL